MEIIELVISQGLKIILLLVLFMVVVMTVVYFVYRIRAIRSGIDKQEQYQDILQKELIDWALTYENKRFAAKDMFSSRRMTNGEIELQGLEVKIKNYANDVPWFIKVR